MLVRPPPPCASIAPVPSMLPPSSCAAAVQLLVRRAAQAVAAPCMPPTWSMQQSVDTAHQRHARSIRTAAAALHASAHAHTGDFLLSLERSVGEMAGADVDMRATRGFGAEVFPDLPAATTWANLWKSLGKPIQSQAPAPATAAGAVSGQQQHAVPEDVAAGVLKVTTVAANLRSMSDIEARMVAAVRAARPADALLLVTGSHPVRSLPGTRTLLPTSLATLEAASRLRARGELPASTQLWAVANPNTEVDASLAEEKVARGAQVLLTQPPLDTAAFERWLGDAERRGVTRESRLVVGHPWITSPGNALFWGALARCSGAPGLTSLIATLRAAEAQGGSDGLSAACNEYNGGLVARALGEWKGVVGGLHVMPLTKKARQGVVVALAPGGVLHAVRTGTVQQ